MFIEANLFATRDHFGTPGTGAYGFFNLSLDEGQYVSANLSSPSGLITSSASSASSSSFLSFEALRDEIQAGSWTLTLGRDEGGTEPEFTTYQFFVDVSGLDAPESFSIVNPANGASDVSSGPIVFEWNKPSDVFSSQGVDLTDVTDLMSRPTRATIEIGPNDSTFDYGAPGLNPGRQYLFLVQYSKDVTSDVSISTPLDEFSNPLVDFSYSLGLNNEAEAVFTTVPEPAAWTLISGVVLAGWTWARRSHRPNRA